MQDKEEQLEVALPEQVSGQQTLIIFLLTQTLMVSATGKQMVGYTTTQK